MTRLPLALLFACTVHAWAQYTVETIPNNRPVDGSHISDPDTLLGFSTRITLDSLLIDIENQTTAQVALVAVKSIGEADIFDFAHQLFNTWGIGHENDNGVLILLVTDQRTIRFHTGGGVQGILTDVTCKRIQRDYMVPFFKEGDYEGGLIAGVRRVHELMTDPESHDELEYVEDGELQLGAYEGWMLFMAVFYGVPFLIVFGVKAVGGTFKDAKSPARGPYKDIRLKRSTWLVLFGLVPLVIVMAFALGPPEESTGWALGTLYLYFMSTLVYRLVRERALLKKFVKSHKYYEASQFCKSTRWFWFFMAVIFPLPFVVHFFAHLTRARYYRNHPRECRLCKASMRKLSEREEDKFLNESQQFEEKIRSIDYDVWLCTACAATREWNYVNGSSKYDRCRSCGTKAYYSKSRRTVVSPTYSSAGQGKEVFECKYCLATATTTYTIAQLVESSSSDSSSSSSSSSDWGGGSSDGGGASSSW